MTAQEITGKISSRDREEVTASRSRITSDTLPWARFMPVTSMDRGVVTLGQVLDGSKDGLREG